MDNFQILGINPTSDMSIIKKAYKNMAQQTHPDKFNGNRHFFDIVAKAYKELEGIYKVRNTSSRVRENIHDIVSTSSNTKPCEESKFNQYFEENHVKESDPFSKGYRKYMSSDKTREDASELSKSSVNRRDKQLVVLYEPEAASTTKNKWLDSVRPLGVKKIDDYTCAYGADYMNTHQEPDDIKCNRKEYLSIEQLQHERETMRTDMTNEEKKKYKEFLKKQKVEEYNRQKNIKRNDKSIYEQYVNIHNRLR